MKFSIVPLNFSNNRDSIITIDCLWTHGILKNIISSQEDEKQQSDRGYTILYFHSLALQDYKVWVYR